MPNAATAPALAALPAVTPPGASRSWLVRFRWALTAAQLLTVLVIDRARGSHVHLPQALAFIGIGAASNLLYAVWQSRCRDVGERTLGLVIAFDVVLLTAVLVQGGGYSSPLSFLYMVEVAVAAVALGRAWAWGIVALSFACSFGLIFHHSGHTHGAVPAAPADIDMQHREHALLHLEGMWIAFAVITYFVARLRRALAARDAELAAERALAARNERLASLATLAAGAAHELATPLATVATVAREIERRTAPAAAAAPGTAAAGATAEDARLIRQEVERCRNILQSMTAEAGATAADPSTALRVRDLFEAALEGLAGRAQVEQHIAPAAEAAVFEAPPRALAQALRCVLRNAIDVSPKGTPVALCATREGDQIHIEITDRGGGMPADVLARAGDPFFTTKEPGSGMGLGLFLTRTVLERVGGSLALDSGPSKGTRALLSLPVRGATNHRMPGAGSRG